MITGPREQYGNTIHLFIGTGHSPDKITFMSLVTNHNHDTNYQGLCGLFLFKLVPPSSQACHRAEALSIVASAYIFHAMPICILSCRRCFCLEDLRQRRRPPTHTLLDSHTTLMFFLG
jgi:hypothetical protein